MSKPKLLDPQEILDLGIAQELNRLLLHPRGLAFGVFTDNTTGNATQFLGIIDHRDKKDGVMFNPDLLDPKKKKAFDKLAEGSVSRRKSLFNGTTIQPLR